MQCQFGAPMQKVDFSSGTKHSHAWASKQHMGLAYTWATEVPTEAGLLSPQKPAFSELLEEASAHAVFVYKLHIAPADQHRKRLHLHHPPARAARSAARTQIVRKWLLLWRVPCNIVTLAALAASHQWEYEEGDTGCGRSESKPQHHYIRVARGKNSNCYLGTSVFVSLQGACALNLTLSTRWADLFL